MARIEDRVTGWWVFAATLLLIAGVLNIIWGIAAIGDARFFVADHKYIISSLHTWGWVTLSLGVLQGLPGSRCSPGEASAAGWACSLPR
jgi:hypothetical protein